MKINVKGEDYKILYVKRVDSDGNCGECNKRTKTIKIDKTLSKGEQQATLIHELFHAVLAEVSASELLSQDLEEVIVENLSVYVLKYFSDMIDKAKKTRSKKLKTKKSVKNEEQ